MGEDYKAPAHGDLYGVGATLALPGLFQDTMASLEPTAATALSEVGVMSGGFIFPVNFYSR